MEEKIILGVIGVITGFLGALLKSWLDSREQVDQSIRDSRLNVYPSLWKHTKIVPEWPRATDLNGEKLEDLSRALRAWYFGEKDETAVPGGMFLSEEARFRYGEAQKAIRTAITRLGSEGRLDPATKDYNSVREPLSLLRTEMTRDLLSRRRDLWTSLRSGWRHFKAKFSKTLNSN